MISGQCFSYLLLCNSERFHFELSLWCIGEGNGNPLQCSCLENPRDGGAWWAAVYGVTQSWTRLKRLSSSSIYVTNLSLNLSNLKQQLLSHRLPWWLSGKASACNAGDPGSIPGSGSSLEKGMTIHSRILAWRAPWTEEPGGLQSMGSQRVRHDWAPNTFTSQMYSLQAFLGNITIWQVFRHYVKYPFQLASHLSLLSHFPPWSTIQF